MFQTKRKIIQNHGIKGVTRDRRNKQTKHNQPECQKPEKKGIYGQYQQMCIVVKKIEEKNKRSPYVCPCALFWTQQDQLQFSSKWYTVLVSGGVNGNSGCKKNIHLVFSHIVWYKGEEAYSIVIGGCGISENVF